MTLASSYNWERYDTNLMFLALAQGLAPPFYGAPHGMWHTKLELGAPRSPPHHPQGLGPATTNIFPFFQPKNGTLATTKNKGFRVCEAPNGPPTWSVGCGLCPSNILHTLAHPQGVGPGPYLFFANFTAKIG